MTYQLRPATADDVPLLGPIEIAAGAGFADIGMHEIAADPPFSPDVLAGYQRDGRAWVFVAGREPVAYLLADRIDDAAHVEQVSVRPAHAGHGLGAALIATCSAWGRDTWGTRVTTLTTFADVPWNAPYYARLGFSIMPVSSLTPELAALRDRERAHGLDRWPRVAMRRELPAGPVSRA